MKYQSDINNRVNNQNDYSSDDYSIDYDKSRNYIFIKNITNIRLNT